MQAREKSSTFKKQNLSNPIPHSLAPKATIGTVSKETTEKYIEAQKGV
ncbi:MAG: hypothetical protein ACP5GU_08100 [Thermoprotei archaeon]|jgi:hypothetical protein